MKLGVSGPGDAPARRLYERLSAELGDLDALQQLAVVQCFRSGLVWDEIPEYIRRVFRTTAARP